MRRGVHSIYNCNSFYLYFRLSKESIMSIFFWTQRNSRGCEELKNERSRGARGQEKLVVIWKKNVKEEVVRFLFPMTTNVMFHNQSALSMNDGRIERSNAWILCWVLLLSITNFLVSQYLFYVIFLFELWFLWTLKLLLHEGQINYMTLLSLNCWCLIAIC